MRWIPGVCESNPEPCPNMKTGEFSPVPQRTHGPATTFRSGCRRILLTGPLLCTLVLPLNAATVAAIYHSPADIPILQWTNVKPFAWGGGANGKPGNNSTAQSSVPVAVAIAGVPSTRTVAAGDRNLTGWFHLAPI